MNQFSPPKPKLLLLTYSLFVCVQICRGSLYTPSAEQVNNALTEFTQQLVERLTLLPQRVQKEAPKKALSGALSELTKKGGDAAKYLAALSAMGAFIATHLRPQVEAMHPYSRKIRKLIEDSNGKQRLGEPECCYFGEIFGKMREKIRKSYQQTKGIKAILAHLRADECPSQYVEAMTLGFLAENAGVISSEVFSQMYHLHWLEKDGVYNQYRETVELPTLTRLELVSTWHKMYKNEQRIATLKVQTEVAKDSFGEAILGPLSHPITAAATGFLAFTPIIVGGAVTGVNAAKQKIVNGRKETALKKQNELLKQKEMELEQKEKELRGH